MSKLKIVIAGIGGVGGFFGGKLAHYYAQSKSVEISFLGRGDHLIAIKHDGLTVLQGEEKLIAYPKIASDHSKDLGIADYIFIASKAYDLESISQSIKDSVGKNTVIIPLLNGVDSYDNLKQIFPNNKIWQGCAYIVSRIKAPGIIENSGNVQSLFFGEQGVYNEKAQLLEQICREAGILAKASSNIDQIVWEKFIFISPTATATSYFDQCLGQVITNQESFLIELINEIMMVAKGSGKLIDSTLASRTLEKMKALPYSTTSSMHADFQKNKKETELYSLTEYVVEASKSLHLKAPTYTTALKELKLKLKQF